jgi:2-oxoisovalerate dehydrogenase E1 component
MYGKAEGCSGGRGGSMHLFDKPHQFLWRQCHCRRRAAAGRRSGAGRQDAGPTGSPPVFSARARWPRASSTKPQPCRLWNLPVLFVCENNGYAMGTALERTEAETDIHAKAAGYRIDRRSGRRHGCGRRRGRCAARAEAHPRNRRAVFSGMPDLPLPGPFDVRRPALPRPRKRSPEWRQKGPIVRFQGWLLENKPDR